MPTRLTVQALDAQGQPTGRTGTALLLVDDGAAVLTLADGGQPVSATPVSANGRAACRAAVALTGGVAQVDVVLTTPGRTRLPPGCRMTRAWAARAAPSRCRPPSWWCRAD
ncbi:MAG: hypothetical protein HYX51_04025 [Chloroflexi bacterium]|nr:hypothetical protein [Chloroflexota bacterium]